MKRLIIFGSAHQKIIQTFHLNNDELAGISLLDFLRANQIPVASSCLGDGVCKKCFAIHENGKILTCQVTLQDLFVDSEEETLTFPYL